MYIAKGGFSNRTLMSSSLVYGILLAATWRFAKRWQASEFRCGSKGIEDDFVS